MEHLEAIDAGLAAKQPYNEIARKVFLTYPTKAFIGNEERQYEILNDVATYFHIPINSIQVTGSAKVGHSIHKKTPFAPRQSDLDLAVIDSSLFIWYLEIGLRLSKGYSDGAVFPVRETGSTQSEYLRYLARGIFRPDLMPTGEERANWRKFFGQLSAKHTDLFKSISAAIYLSQACFEGKQRSAIKVHAAKGVI
jgi:hypothetical protein